MTDVMAAIKHTAYSRTEEHEHIPFAFELEKKIRRN